IEGLDSGRPKPEEPPRRDSEQTSREEPVNPPEREGSVTGMIRNLSAGGAKPEEQPARPSEEKLAEPPRQEGSVTGMIKGLGAGRTEKEETIPPERARASEERPADAPKQEGSVTGMIRGLDAPPSEKEDPTFGSGQGKGKTPEAPRSGREPQQEGSVTGMIENLGDDQSGRSEPRVSGEARAENAPKKSSVTGMIEGLDTPGQPGETTGEPEERKNDPRASLRSGNRVFEIEGGVSVLGRDPDCELAVEDPRVSWRHAAIKLEGGAHVIEDLGSRNGTWLNDKRLAGRVALQNEDVIRVGGTQLVFRTGSGRAEAPSSRSEPKQEGSITGMIQGLNTGRSRREE
ncbi:MAG: FHA domain-containing protein, partial [Rubrobacteraceae bacterium]